MGFVNQVLMQIVVMTSAWVLIFSEAWEEGHLPQGHS